MNLCEQVLITPIPDSISVTIKTQVEGPKWTVEMSDIIQLQ
jgi:hypothetical protein